MGTPTPTVAGAPPVCSGRGRSLWGKVSDQELGLPGWRDTPAQGLPIRDKLPWEPTSPKAPSGTLEIQGWRLRVWAGLPGLGQFCQLLPSPRPAPHPLSFGPWAREEAELPQSPALCCRQRAGGREPVHRPGLWNQRGPSSPESSLAGTQRQGEAEAVV